MLSNMFLEILGSATTQRTDIEIMQDRSQTTSSKIGKLVCSKVGIMIYFHVMYELRLSIEEFGDGVFSPHTLPPHEVLASGM